MYRGITSNLVVTWSMYSARSRGNRIDQESPTLSPPPPGAAQQEVSSGQRNQPASPVFTAAPHHSHYHLSSASCQILHYGSGLFHYTPPCNNYQYQYQFSRSVVSDSLRPHELQPARPPCPSPTPRVYSDSCPLSR